MNHFTTKHAASIGSVLSGFDRLVIRGSLRRLSFVQGMMVYLSYRKLLLKDFGAHSEEVTKQIKEASLAPVTALGRPVIYVASARADKEAIAREVAQKDGVTEGPICVLTSVESCNSFEIYRNRGTKHIELVSRRRKCIHLYHYMIDPVFGFMNARIQTWFPFNIQMCLNGREWLARQMAAEGLGFERRDNCFVYLSDAARAQELLDAQVRIDWSKALYRIARALNPLHEKLFADFCSDYYWSAHQSEWATDTLFSDPEALRALYPKLIRHSMTSLNSRDVMRFLGRKLSPKGFVLAKYAGEIVSDVKTRQEGVRIKHRVGSNSVKAYDKAYTDTAAVLRVETTMNDEQDFKVYRRAEGDADGLPDWRPLRKGVADLPRRAQVSQACNDRYLDALACVDENATLHELTCRVTVRTSWKGKSVRALHLFEHEDAQLLEAVSRGEFAFNGLRNRDLRSLLFGQTASADPQEVKRNSARVTRMIRMLRAHGILGKVQSTHRYQLSKFGRQLTSATSAAKNLSVGKLLERAA